MTDVKNNPTPGGIRTAVHTRAAHVFVAYRRGKN
jgi:hypothetical protein